MEAAGIDDLAPAPRGAVAGAAAADAAAGRAPWRGLRRGIDALVIGVAVMVCVVLPHPRRWGYPTNETAVVQNLKALATAQAQYINKQDTYAASGEQLNSTGTLIAADLKNAFEEWQNNGDNFTAQPKAGYVFRMLLGDDWTGPRGFCRDPDDPRAGLNTWAVIARAARPGTSGENQYIISEAGTVYTQPEPAPGDPRYMQFLADTWPGEDRLELRGWKRVK